MDKLITRIRNTLSYTMVIPKNESVLNNLDAIAEKFESNCAKYNLEFVSMGTDENFKCQMATVKYLGREFKISFYVEPYYKQTQGHLQVYHKLSYLEKQSLEKDKLLGLTVVMDYSQCTFHPVVCYHIQLKAMCCLIDDMSFCVDFNSERVLSGVWCQLQAKSQIPPSLKYLYTVQAVGSDVDDGKVWLHTHGLNRCGFIEFEIMDSNTELCNNHAVILSNFADWIISNPKPIEEHSPIIIGKDINENNIVLTWINWEVANKHYDKMLIGGANYRDLQHSRLIGTLYALKDVNSNELIPLTAMDTSNYEHAIMVLPEQENVRISSMAKERLNFLRNWSALSSAKSYVKIALPIPEEKQQDASGKYEHIWCTLHKMDKTSMYCEINDVPRYIDDVQRGSKVKVSLDNLSDWYLEVDNMKVTPDTVYQLVE